MAYMKVPPLKKKLETLKYDPNPLTTEKEIATCYTIDNKALEMITKIISEEVS